MNGLFALFNDAGLGAPYAGVYDPWLVALSVVVASLANLAALSVASRVGDASNWRSRWAWSIAGAAAMGGGVWAMHFIGMLAFSLPCGVTYDLLGTFLSAAPGIFASAVALRIVGAIGAIGQARKVLGAILIGAGIGAMHYSGMAAMQPDAIIRYSPGLFALSVIVAVALAYAALQIFAVVRSRVASELEASYFAAPVMGLAVAGMHYTAMEAASFYPVAFSDDFGMGYAGSTPLAILVASGSMFVGIVAIVASIAGRHWRLSRTLAEEVGRRKALERQAEARRARLQAILDGVVDAIVTVDRQGRIQQWSAGAERIFGYAPEEIVGQSVTRLMPPLHGDQHAHYVDAYLATGFAKIIGKGQELTGIRKDGSEFPLELAVSRVDDDDEVFFTGIMRDITQRKAAEAALVQAREQAEAANLAKSQFLATMSHEIRTPMNGVLGMANLLAFTDLNARQQRLLGNIQRSGKGLLGIINNILDLAKIEAGKFELTQTQFRLRDVVDDLSELFAERCEQKGVELIYYVDEALPDQVEGDPTRLRQVLTNLVGNAVKFTEAGEILIEAKLGAQSDDGFTLVCAVRDTGIGIAQDEIDRVFESFHQVDGTLTRSSGGTGLGLSITQLLVRLMGGEISVESALGEGSTFTFTTALRAAPQAADEERRPPTPWGGFRLLLAEKNTRTAEILQDYLRGWGVDVEPVPSLLQARASLSAAASMGYRFDAIIVDVKGYGDDAVMFAEQARISDPEVCIVALTSLDRHAIDEALAKKGFAAILPKPVGASDLFNALAPAAAGLAQIRPRASQSRAATTEGTGFDGRVLIVEDNLVNQEVAVGMLEHLGCRWETAADGQRALQMAASEHFDVILMDCEMPVMDGMEATRRIREFEAATAGSPDRPARRTPIVALTAHALNEIQGACEAAGMDDFMTKPFDEAQLVRALSRWMKPIYRPEAPAATPAVAVEAPAQRPEGDVEASPLDLIVVNKLRERDRPERPSRFAKLVGQFAEIMPALLMDIEMSADNGDLERLWRGAHSMKSSAGALGALKLAARCAEIETAGRDGREDELHDLCRHLEHDVNAAIDALNALLPLRQAS